MKRKTGLVCSMIASAMLVASTAGAGEMPIDISAFTNAAWTFNADGCSLNNGSTFPKSDQDLAGVPFSIPAGTYNFWAGCVAANGGSGTVSITIPVGVYGVTSAFTLIDTMWSQPGPQAYVSVTFNGNNGATFTQPLVGGVNIRDYNNDGGQNNINNTSTVQAWTNNAGQRLDRQEYILPSEFATQTLTSVTITDNGGQNFSRAIFAGLTVCTCQALVAEGLTISSGTIRYRQHANLYTQSVTLTNVGTTPISGPVYFVLEGLTGGVSILNPTSPTVCYFPIGSPYVVAIPQGSSLAPNAYTRVRLGFSAPAGVKISYMPLTINGQAGTP